MLKYAEDFKYNPQLRDKVSELRLAVEQEGEEEMLAMVDLDQWCVLSVCVFACVCAYVRACVRVCVCAYMCECERH